MIYCGDCLEVMPTLPDKSIDMILCDLPYGTTACKWDVVIPFEPLWKEYKRLIKDNVAIVLTASQPFTSALVMSNPKWFRYEWVWEKERPTNFLQGNKQPMKYHENICVFYKSQPTYNAQLTKKLEKNKRKNAPRGMTNQVYGINSGDKYQERTVTGGAKDWLYPSTIQYFTMQREGHPTQKPVALFEYLIRTYTNEGDTVLDNCAGSGTTGVACIRTNRKYILIEKDPKYVAMAERRIKQTQPLENQINRKEL